MPASPLDLAFQWVTKYHVGQVRDGEAALPYATHPVEVLVNLRYTGGITDEKLLVTALLHDLLEETEAEFGKLKSTFGSDVAALVKELTRHEPSKSEIAGLSKEAIWKLRSETLLDEIRKMSPEAQTIKLADRLSNLREAFRTKQEEKLVRYLAQTRTILTLVPRPVNPGLWDAIDAELPSRKVVGP